LLIRAVVPPLLQAVKVAGAIAEGRLDNPIAIKGRDEAAQPLSALSVMQKSLAENLYKVVAVENFFQQIQGAA
jgi:methyl-accepting chemotaxis protein